MSKSGQLYAALTNEDQGDPELENEVQDIIEFFHEQEQEQTEE